MGSFVLHTGLEPKLFQDGERVSVQDLRIRNPDALILQHMMQGSCENPDRNYTVLELWKVGWTEVVRAGKSPEAIKDSVQGAISHLRSVFPGTFPSKAAGGWKLLQQVTDRTPLDPPLLVAHRIFIGCVITSLSVVAVDTPSRALLSGLKLTLVQTTKRPKAIEAIVGVFQGVCGSVLYSVPIAFGLFYLWFRVYDHEPWKARYPRLIAASIGAAMGALGGFIISAILVWAQNPVTIHDASWILTKVPLDPWDAWAVTHVALSMPWFGLWAGAAVVLAVMEIMRSSWWASFLDANTVITNPEVGLRILVALFKRGALYSAIYVFPALLTAALLFTLIPNDPISKTRIFGESMVVAMGGVGFIPGFMVALYSLTKGADIAGNDKCALTLDIERHDDEL